MKDILNKLSSYNIFNYLFPGIIFVVIAEIFTQYSFIIDDIILGLFFYYFIGLVISRFGSIVIESLLKKLSILEFASYDDFVSASKKDEKIEILSEVNNMYRTLCSAVTLLLLLKIYEYFEAKLPFLIDVNLYIILFLLLITFLFSYRKQTNYITKRIKSNV